MTVTVLNYKQIIGEVEKCQTYTVIQTGTQGKKNKRQRFVTMGALLNMHEQLNFEGCVLKQKTASGGLISATHFVRPTLKSWIMQVCRITS